MKCQTVRPFHAARWSLLGRLGRYLVPFWWVRWWVRWPRGATFQELGRRKQGQQWAAIPVAGCFPSVGGANQGGCPGWLAGLGELSLPRVPPWGSGIVMTFRTLSREFSKAFLSEPSSVFRVLPTKLPTYPPFVRHQITAFSPRFVPFKLLITFLTTMSLPTSLSELLEFVDFNQRSFFGTLHQDRANI